MTNIPEKVLLWLQCFPGQQPSQGGQAASLPITIKIQQTILKSTDWIILGSTELSYGFSRHRRRNFQFIKQGALLAFPILYPENERLCAEISKIQKISALEELPISFPTPVAERSVKALWIFFFFLNFPPCSFPRCPGQPWQAATSGWIQSSLHLLLF